MGIQKDDKDQLQGDDSQQRQERGDSGGASGHGAASAMARMISQGRKHRHLAEEADDTAGVQGS